MSNLPPMDPKLASAVQTAIAQETLDTAFMFRQNAAMNHSIPTVPGRNVISIGPDQIAAGLQPAPSPVLPAAPTQPVQQTSTSQQSSSSDTTSTTVTTATTSAAPQSRLMKSVAIATLGLGLGTGALGLFALSKQEPAKVDSKPAVVQPAKPSGSLLKWLEDEGYNLPTGDVKNARRKR